MSATIPLVSWNLEQACTFRPVHPDDELRSLAAKLVLKEKEPDIPDYETYYSAGFQLFHYRGQSWRLPHHGQVDFSSVGSPARFKSVCENCPAGLGQPAACIGYFSRYDLPESLKDLVKRRGLEAQMATIEFADKSPWHALWATSPLPPSTLAVLVKLFADCDEEIARFHHAARIALRDGRNLHVHLSPLGHMDFGYHTTYAHCPRCKADEDQVRRLPEETVVGDTHACEVCGEQFDLGSTAESKPHTSPDLSEPDPVFQRAWLMEHGVDRAMAEEVVAARLAENRQWQEKRARSAFVRKHLIQDLRPEGAMSVRNQTIMKELGMGDTHLDEKCIWGRPEILTIIERAEDLEIPIMTLAWVPEHKPERIIHAKTPYGIREGAMRLRELRPWWGAHRYRLSVDVRLDQCGEALPAIEGVCSERI